MTKMKPRTPEYFPKMKVRGARRKRLAPFQRLTGAFKNLTVTGKEAATHFKVLGTILNLDRDECVRLAAKEDE